MLAGAASIIDGMASIGGALFDHRPSTRMRRVLRDLRRSDAERLARDWDMVIPRTPRSRPRDRTPD
jgi:hypothetical protein